MSREAVAEEVRGALSRLTVALERVGSPFVSQARPGASLEQIQVVAEGLGLVFPAELVQLYQWHNGLDYLPGVNTNLPESLDVYDLAQAEEWVVWWREAEWDAELGRWPVAEGYFPILTTGGSEDYWVDCRGDPAEPAAVVSYWSEDQLSPYLAAVSITSMVSQMARLVERRMWECNPVGPSHILIDEEQLRAEGLTFFITEGLGRVEID